MRDMFCDREQSNRDVNFGTSLCLVHVPTEASWPDCAIPGEGGMLGVFNSVDVTNVALHSAIFNSFDVALRSSRLCSPILVTQYYAKLRYFVCTTSHADAHVSDFLISSRSTWQGEGVPAALSQLPRVAPTQFDAMVKATLGYCTAVYFWRLSSVVWSKFSGIPRKIGSACDDD